MLLKDNKESAFYGSVFRAKFKFAVLFYMQNSSNKGALS